MNLKIIEDQYEIKIITCEEIKKDKVWKLITKNKNYILKKKANKESIEKEIELINNLKNSGFDKIQYFIKTKSNNNFVNINSDFYMLYDFIEGKNVDIVNSKERLVYVEKISKFLGILHKYLENIDIKNFPKSNMMDTLDNYILNFVKNNKDIIDSKKTLMIIDILKNDFPKLYNKLPRRYIHRDFHSENILFNDKNDIKALIDFEISVEEVGIFDLVYFNSSILSGMININKQKEWFSVLDSSLNGYSKYYKIEKEEAMSFFYILLQLQLIFTVWFYSTGETERIEESQKILFWVYDNRKGIEEIINKYL